MSEPEEEPLTSFQLELAIRIVVAQDRWLRNRLVKLRRDKPESWRKAVKDVQDELVRRAGRIGHLEYRIRAVTKDEEHV